MIANSHSRIAYPAPPVRVKVQPSLASPQPRGGVGDITRWAIDGATYVNRDTGKMYAAHHELEARAIQNDAPRYVLFKGGEGGGKSVAGIVKCLGRLRRGMDGIMGSPDFEHFKRSLWPEFTRWCPWESVIPEQRYRSRAGWEPTKPFTLTFLPPVGGTATLYCGGFDDPGGWEGPNVNFAHFDEARRHKTAAMLKVLDGRCRILGRHGEVPQIVFTTTPRKNWLFEYFGPLTDSDLHADFKAETLVVDLYTEDNERAGNLMEGFTRQRRQSLTEAEARVLLEAAWEDIDDIDRFLASITLWDACRAELPPLDVHTPMVLAADAGVSNDSFGLIGVTRHPQDDTQVAVRYVRSWVPSQGRDLDFTPIENEIRALCSTWDVVQLAYDPYQLHHMMSRLQDDDVVWTHKFDQGPLRLEADKQLLDLITQRRIAHDGNVLLRSHIDNADRKVDPESRKLRIVKRSGAQKVDLAVALSMATARCLKLNL